MSRDVHKTTPSKLDVYYTR